MKNISRQKWVRYFLLWGVIVVGLVISFSMTKENQLSLVDIFAMTFLFTSGVFSVFLFIKSIGRLKDIGISSWWMLLIFIPIIG